jgi:hypothetical protein
VHDAMHSGHRFFYPLFRQVGFLRRKIIPKRVANSGLQNNLPASLAAETQFVIGSTFPDAIGPVRLDDQSLEQFAEGISRALVAGRQQVWIHSLHGFPIALDVLRFS